MIAGQSCTVVWVLGFCAVMTKHRGTSCISGCRFLIVCIRLHCTRDYGCIAVPLPAGLLPPKNDGPQQTSFGAVLSRNWFVWCFVPLTIFTQLQESLRFDVLRCVARRGFSFACCAALLQHSFTLPSIEALRKNAV